MDRVQVPCVRCWEPIIIPPWMPITLTRSCDPCCGLSRGFRGRRVRSRRAREARYAWRYE